MQLNAKWNILKGNPCTIVAEKWKKIIEGRMFHQGRFNYKPTAGLRN